MLRTAEQLRDDALRIWRAGVNGVQPERLMPEFVRVEGNRLWLGDEFVSLDEIGRIAVVGGGKAAAAMALAVEQAIGPAVLKDHAGPSWVNIPAGAEAEVALTHLHAARPQGANEPTAAAVDGVAEMLRIVAALGPADLCICLLTGGASALLPAPVHGISLADKVTLTRELSARGATIHQLNAVRSAISRIKGGGLARACRAGSLVSLILSDVPGDDLATIASGPTILTPLNPHTALHALESLQLGDTDAGRRAMAVIGAQIKSANAASLADPAVCRVTNLLIGNNAAAVDAAGIEAERLGYSHAMISASEPEGLADDVAGHLAGMARRMRDEPGPDCLISGGETTVALAPPPRRGLGGRNQQLALAALVALHDWRDLALVSGGTDGEDGPTDAAGAWVDANVVHAAHEAKLDARQFLAGNDAYRFFEQTGGLLKTGPTHTNVCDLRVLTVSRQA